MGFPDIECGKKISSEDENISFSFKSDISDAAASQSLEFEMFFKYSITVDRSCILSVGVHPTLDHLGGA